MGLTASSFTGGKNKNRQGNKLLSTYFGSGFFGSVPNVRSQSMARSFYEGPDIPLREPLDNDYKINRRKAREIYQEEKKRKVLENKQAHLIYKEQQTQHINKEAEKKQKLVEKEKQQIEEIKKKQVLDKQ